MIHGWYYDPLHGHCLRRVDRVGPDLYRIVGVYGDDEPNTHAPLTAWMRATETSPDGSVRLDVDFSGKPINIEIDG